MKNDEEDFKIALPRILQEDDFDGRASKLSIDPPEELLEDFWPSPGGAQVNAGGIAAFESALPRDSIPDVSDSLLFAQLAADAAADRFGGADQRPWIEEFLNVLSRIGWTQLALQGPTPVDEVATVILPTIVLDILEANAALRAPAAQRALEAAKQLKPNSAGFKLWAERATSGENCSFFVAVAASSQDGPRIDIVYVKVVRSQEHVSILDWLDTAQGFVAYYGLALNGNVYDRVREQIAQRLGDHRKRLTFPLMSG